MNCSYHQDRVAVGQCSNCGCRICSQCNTVVNEKMYCNLCASHLFNQSFTGPDGMTTAMATKDAMGATGEALALHGIKKANWFQRHLNWTLGLCGFLGAYVAGFAAAFLVVLVTTAVNPYSKYDSLSTLGQVLYSCTALATLIGVTVWYLKKKGRHLGNLAWLIVPFGFIVLLCLENKSS